MNLHIYKKVNEINEALAQYIIEIGRQAIVTNGKFNFVLTGGNSPKGVYGLLSTKYKNDIDWSKVFFFFGDERTVEPFHKDYNGLMAKETLFDQLKTPAEHIFYVNTYLQPEDAAKAYKKSIDKHFEGKEPIFDLVLLGMGDDAHTASIFPHTTLTDVTEADVQAVFVEKLDTYRISFTAPLINMAANVAFLTFGKSKATALYHVLGPQKDYASFPAQLINPAKSPLNWFIDEEAYELCNKNS